MNNKTTIHIGNLITQHVNKKRASRAELARVIGKSSSAVSYYLKSSSLPAHTILVVSNALKHNFFADMAALLPETFTTSAPKYPGAEQRIAELEHEIQILKAEKQLLLEVVKKPSQT